MKGKVVVMSGVTDCYQPFERKFQITRQCLEVLLDFKNPVGIITKNKLVTRDIDILKQMARYNGACVMVSITTLDPHVARVMEPRASTPANRLRRQQRRRRRGAVLAKMKSWSTHVQVSKKPPRDAKC